MSFFIFKSSYSLLIFIHMHIDFYLVEHNIYIPLSCLHPEHFPVLLQLKGKWSFLLHHLGFILGIVRTIRNLCIWTIYLDSNCFYYDGCLALLRDATKNNINEICYSPCYIYI